MPNHFRNSIKGKNMKTVITLIIILVQFSFSQRILGIEFGKSLNSQTNNLSGYERDSSLDAQNRVAFSGGKFLTYENCIVQIATNIKGNVIGVFVITEGKTFRTTVSSYVNLRDMVIERYGEGENMTEFYPPYYLGDGYEGQAIRLDKGKIRHRWLDVNGINIVVMITSIGDDFRIILFYSDNLLQEEQENIQKLEMKKDF
jgi:hypothetical protein